MNPPDYNDNDYERTRQRQWHEEQAEKERETRRLQQMSIPELRAELEYRTKNALIEEIGRIKGTVARVANDHAAQVVRGALGFTESFGKWEVDHCNGRNTPMANALGEIALTQIKLAIPDFIHNFIAEIKKEDLGMFDAGRRNYKEQLSRQITSYVQKWLEDEAVRRGKEIVEQLKQLPPPKEK